MIPQLDSTRGFEADQGVDFGLTSQDLDTLILPRFIPARLCGGNRPLLAACYLSSQPKTVPL